MNGARLRYPLVTGWQTPMSSAPWVSMCATRASMSSTENITRRMPSVFTGASTGPNLTALGVWNLSSSMPCPSGVRIIARVARTSLSPIKLPTAGPSTVVSPSSLRPSSMKNALAASRSSTTMRTLSIRLSVMSFLSFASLLMPVLAARGVHRVLGVRGPLVPQNNMRGLLRRCKFNAFVSQSPQVDAFEQSLSTTEQDRRDSNVQLIDKALTKILLDRVGPTTNSHVSSGGRLSCPVKRLANAARDELKRRVAFHLNGWTRMMSQDGDWNVIRRVVAPPAFPVHVRPGTANRSEHVPSENPCPNILKAARGEVFVNPRGTAVFAKQGPLERACRE